MDCPARNHRGEELPGDAGAPRGLPRQQRHQQQHLDANGHPAQGGNLNGLSSSRSTEALPDVTYPCRPTLRTTSEPVRKEKTFRRTVSGNCKSPFMQAMSIATDVIRTLPPASEGCKGTTKAASPRAPYGAFSTSSFSIPATSTRLSRVLSWSNLANSSTAQQGSSSRSAYFTKAGSSTRSRTANLPATDERKAASFSSSRHAGKQQTLACNEGGLRDSCPPQYNNQAATPPSPFSSAPSSSSSFSCPVSGISGAMPCISAPSSSSPFPCIASSKSSSRRSLDSFCFHFAKDGRAQDAALSKPSCTSSSSSEPDRHLVPCFVPLEGRTSSFTALTDSQQDPLSTGLPAIKRISSEEQIASEAASFSSSRYAGKHQTLACNEGDLRDSCPPQYRNQAATPPSPLSSAPLSSSSFPCPVSGISGAMPCISAPSSSSPLPCIASSKSSSRRSLDSFCFHFAKDGRAQDAALSKPSCASSFSSAPDRHLVPCFVPLEGSTSSFTVLTDSQQDPLSTGLPAIKRISSVEQIASEVGFSTKGRRVGPRTRAILRTLHSAPMY